jgi:hypothetical protein
MTPASIPSQLFSVPSHAEAQQRDDRIFTDDLNITFPKITFRGIIYHHAIINLLTGICSFYQIQNGQTLLVSKLAVKIDLLPINNPPSKPDFSD